MTNLSELTSERRVEAYRDLAMEAVQRAHSTNGRDAALYLNLATQWLRLADIIAARIKSSAES